jgi:hypothetical protein
MIMRVWCRGKEKRTREQLLVDIFFKQPEAKTDNMQRQMRKMEREG